MIFGGLGDTRKSLHGHHFDVCYVVALTKMVKKSLGLHFAEVTNQAGIKAPVTIPRQNTRHITD